MKISKFSLAFIGFLQALGLIIYCGLIAVVFWQGNKWFGRVPNYFGPLLFLLLFTTSALICGIITLYYPFILFWIKKRTDQAIKVILYTVGWMIVFTLLLLFCFAFLR